MYILEARLRRIIYVIIFEFFAIVFSTVLLAAMSQGDAAGSLPVAIVVSVVAVVWNFLYNTGFEALEQKLKLTERTVLTRILHAIGFEGGLILAIIPIFMFWYQVDFIEAFMMEAALLVFFLVYTFVFTWAFDRVFPLTRPVEA